MEGVSKLPDPLITPTKLLASEAFKLGAPVKRNCSDNHKVNFCNSSPSERKSEPITAAVSSNEPEALAKVNSYNNTPSKKRSPLINTSGTPKRKCLSSKSSRTPKSPKTPKSSRTLKSPRTPKASRVAESPNTAGPPENSIWIPYEPPIYEYDEDNKERYAPFKNYKATGKAMVDNGKGLHTEPSAGVCTEISTETPFSTADNFKTFSSEISGTPKSSGGTSQQEKNYIFVEAMMKHTTYIEFDLKKVANRLGHHIDFTRVELMRLIKSWRCHFEYNPEPTSQGTTVAGTAATAAPFSAEATPHQALEPAVAVSVVGPAAPHSLPPIMGSTIDVSGSSTISASHIAGFINPIDESLEIDEHEHLEHLRDSQSGPPNTPICQRSFEKKFDADGANFWNDE